MTPDTIIGIGCILLAELIASFIISAVFGGVSQGASLKGADVWSVTLVIFLVLLVVDVIVALFIIGMCHLLPF